MVINSTGFKRFLMSLCEYQWHPKWDFIKAVVGAKPVRSGHGALCFISEYLDPLKEWRARVFFRHWLCCDFDLTTGFQITRNWRWGWIISTVICPTNGWAGEMAGVLSWSWKIWETCPGWRAVLVSSQQWTETRLKAVPRFTSKRAGWSSQASVPYAFQFWVARDLSCSYCCRSEAPDGLLVQYRPICSVRQPARAKVDLFSKWGRGKSL